MGIHKKSERKRYLWQIALMFIFFQCLPSTVLIAETFEERHARERATIPSDVEFRISVAGAQNRFLIGERIPIKLEFSTSSPVKYKFYGATRARSRGFSTEEFIVDRSDVVDPYRDYLVTRIAGAPTEVLRNYPFLESTPRIIHVELNEWFRFERSGHYRIYSRSHRLARERNPIEPRDENVVQIAPVSNIIEIEILQRDANWEAAKLAEIDVILSSPEPERPKPGGPPVPYDPALEQDIERAKRELRYLGTENAIRLMFEYARTSRKGPDALVLIGASNRAQAIAEFDRYLSNPDVGFYLSDIWLRAQLSFLEESNQDSDWTKSRTALEARERHLDELAKKEAMRLIPLIRLKTAEAREISAEAIAYADPEAAKASGLVLPPDYGLTRGQLIEQFLQFSAKQQSELLTKKWDLVRGPEMIPVLQTVIAKGAKPRTLPTSPWSLWVWGMETDLPDMALRRLNELAPNEASAILRQDIASGKPRFPGFAVLEFPAQDIPEADSALSGQLDTEFPGVLPLVAKFGTARLVDQMRALYATKTMWPCEEEQSFIIYFLRTLPGDATGQGKDLLRHAMANRNGKNRCFQSLLGGISRVLWNPTVKEQAAATLNDPDPHAAANAARVLADNGGPDVEPLLWQELERWSERWKGRAPDLDSHPISGENSNEGEQQLGYTLFLAIGRAKSWLLDELRQQRLLALCVGESCRKQWSEKLASRTVLVDVSSGGVAFPAAFRVAGYDLRTFGDLKTKLAQFPVGTKFRWCPRGSWFSPGQNDEMYGELSTLSSEHSMSIEAYEEKKCMPGSETQ